MIAQVGAVAPPPPQDFSDFLKQPDIGPDGEVIPPLGPTDWYYRTFVPKDPKENIQFRRKVLKLAYRSPKFARELWIICSRDLLFHVNFAGWLLEARAPVETPFYKAYTPFGDAREIPFITRPYQDNVFLEMWRSFGKEDMCVPKSREVGASWIFLYLADWFWRFRPQCHIGMASKDEDALDAPGSPDALFWKLDFINEKLPWFLTLTPEHRERNRASHIIGNKQNASTIQGFAATANMATGGRKFGFFLDEMHKWTASAEYAAQNSLQHVTPSRVYISSVFKEKGQTGAFYDICQKDSTAMRRIEIHWSHDMEKTRGLYTFRNKKLVVLDHRYDFPPNYPFISDGKVRSPYYDDACRRANSERDVAAELDMDFGGAGDKIFEPEILTKMKQHVRRPNLRASLVLDENGHPTPKLIEDPVGEVAIWMSLGVDGEGCLVIPKGRYAIGCDIAMGTGGNWASQSAAVGFDIDAIEQVFEWMDSSTNPSRMADIVWCLGNIFRNEDQVAYVIPESNGGGGAVFCQDFLRKGYSNPYLRKLSDGRDAHLNDRKGRTFGLFNNDGGMRYLMALQEGIRRKGLKIRSERILLELSRYQRKGDKAWHPSVGRKGSGEEKSHGDCAIAAACGWYGIRSDNPYKEDDRPDPIQPNTAAYRRLEFLREHAQDSHTSYWAPHNRVSDYQ